jgi:ribulose-bisphosphate carboxylase large chain
MTFLPPVSPAPRLSGERFRVEYRLDTTDTARAEKIASGIAHEQTVELPASLVSAGYFADEIVGQVEALSPQDSAVHVTVSYAVENAGTGLPQLLNVVYGNSSMYVGVQVVGLSLPESLLQAYRGPRFGVPGLRDALGIPKRPLLSTALKPMGATPEQLAEVAYQFALGGVDIIKDDHGLANQPYCPFEERVLRCAEAVARANAETGGSTLYAPNVTAPHDEIQSRAHFAKANGAGGVMVSFGLTGFDGLRLLAADDSLGLPLLSHPALSGSYIHAAGNGLAHRVLYGQLMRLAGADLVLFVSFGGRFPYTEAQCRDVIWGCSEPMGHLKPIFPTPGGGMTLERIPELHQFYGSDVVFLVAGDLYKQGQSLAQNARTMREMVESLPV